MLFNSYEFAIFFPVVFLTYLCLRHRWQNRWLLLTSYVFYGAWDWRFLALIWLSTIVDFWAGRRIQAADDARARRFPLVISMVTNLGLLATFKYFNFFVGSFCDLFGITECPVTLSVILPVGISFYTFQTMSYTIDIYRRKLKPCNELVDFALFVAFFPQLVAGPIERAVNLLPQITADRKITLEKIGSGLYLMYWGLFKKIVIADNLGAMADSFFAMSSLTGSQTYLAMLCFAFQIYCDFSGYSDIARGCARCMGFELMLNFNIPYIATNPQEFWRRWHISLSTWLRDYLYISLGGNRRGTLNTYRNLALTMLLGGLWHGAAWTFVAWGAYHGLLLIVHRLSIPGLKRIVPAGGPGRWLAGVAGVAFFFHLTLIGWLIFRAATITQAWQMLVSLFVTLPEPGVLGPGLAKAGLYLAPLIFVQIWQLRSDDQEVVRTWHPLARAVWYALLLWGILVFGSFGKQAFIYFQF